MAFLRAGRSLPAGFSETKMAMFVATNLGRLVTEEGSCLAHGQFGYDGRCETAKQRYTTETEPPAGN